jgi:hypothetical protein
MCEQRTEHPPDCTVCVDRRSCGGGSCRSCRAPLLSDSELITLTVAQVLQGYHCERGWIRHIHSPQWRGMFPYLPDQSGYHKRLKNAHPMLCKAILTLASCCLSWFDDMWMTDATPVPCGMSRETVKRSDLAGHAGYGY